MKYQIKKYKYFGYYVKLCIYSNKNIRNITYTWNGVVPEGHVAWRGVMESHPYFIT